MKMLDAGTVRAAALRQTDVALGTVIDNRVLTAPGHPTKCHVELELPENMAYQAGDYLAMSVRSSSHLDRDKLIYVRLPVNPEASVRRALARFGLSHEQEVRRVSLQY
jgi:cytochrome P450/NADPH-cytochrome P450 reductase